nr:TAXI family TRAP transporter solute-binding subunit [Psychromonas ossibalaenae]
MKNKSLLAAAAFTAVTFAPLTHAKEFLTVGTGVYYPAGSGICRLINKDNRSHGIRCNVESTKGAVYNINSLRDGEISLGVTQADQQSDAYNGKGAFASSGKYEDLRSVFSIKLKLLQ